MHKQHHTTHTNLKTTNATKTKATQTTEANESYAIHATKKTTTIITRYGDFCFSASGVYEREGMVPKTLGPLAIPNYPAL